MIVFATHGSGHCDDDKMVRALRKNRLKRRKRTNPMQLLPTLEPFVSFIMGSLPKAKSGRRFLQVITERFEFLTQAVPLRLINIYPFLRAFAENWLSKYGAAHTVITDNGLQFA